MSLSGPFSKASELQHLQLPVSDQHLLLPFPQTLCKLHQYGRQHVEGRYGHMGQSHPS